jgi:hypothetical protein
MHLISLLAKTTQVPLVALSSALRKLRNLTCLAPITLFVMDVFRKTLYVSSTPLSALAYSPESRKQEASAASNDIYANTWVVDSLDPNLRFEMQGEAIKMGEPILIRHCQTSHYLASDNVRHGNDFGGEWEVMCHSFASSNKTQNLQLEKTGAVTSDVPTRF